jgi:cell division protein FtsZ
MFAVNEAADVINQHVDPEAKIIFGTSIDPNLQDEVKVTVIATGFTKEKEDEEYGYPRTQESKMPYTPPRFNRDQDEDRQEPTQPKQQPQPESDEDQLDIPAFIRNKINRDN